LNPIAPAANRETGSSALQIMPIRWPHRRSGVADDVALVITGRSLTSSSARATRHCLQSSPGRQPWVA